MQATLADEQTTKIQPQGLADKKVSDLITHKRRLVEVPYTASLADTLNALMANRVWATPVAAPPGHWIGAGGSMIIESDKQTGAARKHYIGMVTMLDVLAHIGGDDGGDFDRRMQVPVSSIIGHCLESLSLWTLNSNTGLIDCMEVFSKGIHRALVPVDGQTDNVAGVELVELASSYHMVTQMDVVKYLKAHENEVRGILARPVGEVGAVSDVVFGVFDKTKVIDAIRCMNTASLNAVPIVQSNGGVMEDHGQLINVSLFPINCKIMEVHSSLCYVWAERLMGSISNTILGCFQIFSSKRNLNMIKTKLLVPSTLPGYGLRCS
ncbi:hypothetical protein ACS0TY_034260 [Phlomoides rotata]